MRRNSPKTRKVLDGAREFRRSLVTEVGECEVCGHSPRYPRPGMPRECSELACHEIACGALRMQAIDKPYAILVLCSLCNCEEMKDAKKWPQSRQLSVLKKSRPDHYDLKSFNYLVNPRAPNRITQEEVDQW